MTKEEKIKEAYGSRYHKLKESIDCNGWINQNITTRSLFDSLEFNDKENLMRPFELKGIENNNFWTKIKSESDLPEFNKWYFTVSKGSENHVDCEFFTESRKWTWQNYVTHYQPIVKPQSPIY